MVTLFNLLICLFILGILIRLTEQKYNYLSFFYLFLAISIAIVVSGFRGNIGDTYFYKYSYQLLAENPMLSETAKDYGFVLFELFLISISQNPQFLVFATAFITNLFNILSLYRFRNYFELQLFMFITSGYFLTTLNGIRQAMVASLVFFSTSLIIKKKKALYFIIMLLLSTVHQSCLVMIPIYFIVQERPWSKKIWIMIGLLGGGFILYDVLEPTIFALLQGSNYDYYSSFDEGGSSFIRAFIASIPLLGAYLFKDQLEEEWPESRIFVNMTLINVIILCFSMYNWIFARLSYYFLPYSFILLPYLIMKWPNKKEKRILYYGFLVCYFIFMYYEQVIQGLGLGYRMIEGSIF